MPGDCPNTKNYLKEISASNFIKIIGEVEDGEVKENSLTFKIPINAEKHLNSVGSLHGGFILSFVDMAMGSVCKHLGRKITTLDLNINFIKRANLAGYLKITAQVVHNGSKTMVVEAEVSDSENALIAKARGTFFVLGEWIN